MPIYRFGYTVRSRREALGLTQEELADGICSVPTLSRIENGERMPSKENYELLLQRLGYSDTVLYEYVDEKTMLLHEFAKCLGLAGKYTECIAICDTGIKIAGKPGVVYFCPRLSITVRGH